VTKRPRKPRKPKKRWLLCQVKPGQADRAIEHVERQGFEAYHPRFWNAKTHKRQAVFPGYLFVECSGAWGPLSSTTGIIRVICFGEVAAIVPTPEIVRLKRAENEDGNIELDRVEFIQGDKIEVVRGRMKGLVGTFGGLDDMGRIRFMFSMLGMPTQTVVQPRNVMRRAVPEDVGDKTTKDTRLKPGNGL
jgi:transcriptional antiterminator RfaH